MLTEAEAWRTIGEAFEAKAAHPELVVSESTDLAQSGICRALAVLFHHRGELNSFTRYNMNAKTVHAVHDSGGYAVIQPGWSDSPEGVEVRAMLAYLFAEEAAA